MTTKLRFEVPKAQIRFHLGRVHVGTPDADVAADIRVACERAKLTPAQTRKCVLYALQCHRDNQGLYAFVMGGRRTRRTR